MTEPTIDDVAPIHVQMVDCTGYWTDDHGVCTTCRYRSGYTTEVVGSSNHRRPKPHKRPAPVYAISDCSECSCGGWHGTPVSIERQTDGSEDLLLSFQGRVDDIERNQANLVEQILIMNEKLDRLLGE